MKKMGVIAVNSANQGMLNWILALAVGACVEFLRGSICSAIMALLFGSTLVALVAGKERAARSSDQIEVAIEIEIAERDRQ